MKQYGENPPRLTLKELFDYILDLVNFERGIPFTVKELLLRPKETIDIYLNKDRRYIVNPLRFTVLVGALSVLLIVPTFNKALDKQLEKEEASGGSNNLEQQGEAFGRWLGKIFPKKENKELTDEEKLEFKEELRKDFTKEIFSKYLNLILLTSLPFIALFQWLIFKNKGYNYAEHLVIITFLYGLTITLAIPFYAFDLLSLTNVAICAIIASVLTLILSVYLYKKLFNASWWGSIWKTFVLYLGQQVAVLILSIILTIGLVIHRVITG